MAGLAFATPSWAESSGNTVLDALVYDAKIGADLRYRYENVDDDHFTKEAHASTLRTKLRYKTGKVAGISLNFELENIVYLGKEKFNNTVNGVSDRPIVADPNITEVNHLYVSYTGLDKTTITFGRQPLKVDNQRFFGGAAWRQNDQTFDSVVFNSEIFHNLTLTYAYVWNVNRVNGGDHPLGDLSTDTHAIDASYKLPVGKLALYSYFVDLNDAAVVGLSSKTFGVRFSGKQTIADDMKLHYRLEYAKQFDHGDNPDDYKANYFALEAGIKIAGIGGGDVIAKGGYEILGSGNDGTAPFRTPLAGLHKFNGWADRFLATPGAGLQDVYGSIGYRFNDKQGLLKGTRLVFAYHDFSSDYGHSAYGTEWNFLIAKKLSRHFSLLVKLASYNANSFSMDTKKIWVQLGASF